MLSLNMSITRKNMILKYSIFELELFHYTCANISSQRLQELAPPPPQEFFNRA